MKKLVFLSALIFALSFSACSKMNSGTSKMLDGGSCSGGCKSSCSSSCPHSKMKEKADGVRKICPLCNKPGCTKCGMK